MLQAPQVAYDFIQNDQDPSSGFPSHGTSVGGIIGSVKNNDVCGVGIAHEVNLGGEMPVQASLQGVNVFMRN